MTLHQAWMQQAESDLRAAVSVDNRADPRTRCQAISKYQQAVEKSIKSLLDKLFAVALIRQGSDRAHPVARYATVLGRLPATHDNRYLLNQLRRLFTSRIIDGINFLDSLVPAYPEPGRLAVRNHEYPYQETAAEWRAPSEDDAFSADEMRRARYCANSLVPKLRRILDALDLLYP